jgi:Mrp family chromosome partitioning ATPase
MIACRFDDSMPRLAAELAKIIGAPALEAGVVHRDASGRLSFFSQQEKVSEEEVERISQRLREVLGPYARPDRVFVCKTEPGARQILHDANAMSIQVRQGDDQEPFTLRYLDRRIVGADWIHTDEPEAPTTGRIAFASLKGGVGRSTALTVVAAEQARKGRNVLVIDLDLEAPGIGSLLLSDDRLPSFGVMDYLVERNFGPVDRVLVREMVGTSTLTHGQGLVDVVPAVGSAGQREPANYLAKLSRAMIEAIGEGQPVPLAGKLREMLRDLESVRRYDVILMDVRAGLAELAAGPLLSLNAEVLLFGTAQAQTIQDLHYLFAHLATLPSPIGPSQWGRLKMVHAKAAHAASTEAFRDELWNLFTTHLYEQAEGLEGFNFDANVPEAPHYPIVIPLDSSFADWDPVREPSKLVEAYYTRTFGSLFTYVDDLVNEVPADAQD